MDVERSYSDALRCAQTSGQNRLQVSSSKQGDTQVNIPSAFAIPRKNGLTPGLQRRVLRLRLAAQRRRGSLGADDTEAKLRELCAADGRDPDGSDEDEEEEEMDNSEPLEDSDVILSDSGKRSQAVP